MTTRSVVATVLLTALAVPALAPAAASAQTAGPIEVPLEMRDGRMVVPVRSADGAELTFLVSLGSAVTVLSESGAARAAGAELTLGGAPVNLDDAQTIPDERLTVDGVVLDGLVSTNTLNDYDLLFDVPEGRLLLKPFGRAVEWPGTALSEPVPLRIYHGVVAALDVEIDGSSYPAMLEMGAPVLLANQAVLDENGIDDGTASLTLGSTVFTDMPIEVSDHPAIARFSPNGDGFVLVGAPFARECAVSVSFVHRELRTCVR